MQPAANALIAPRSSELRVPELDGVRGIAIFLVLVWHCLYSLLDFEPGSVAAYATACLRFTWSGVDLFFVLSGFLIGGILIDNKESTNYFGAFYVRRMCRIFPLYFACLLSFSIVLIANRLMMLPMKLSWLIEPDSLPLWSYITFSQNILMFHKGDFGSHPMGLTWSLAVEEQFYCVVPFLIRYIEVRKLPWVFIGCILIAPLLRVALSYLFTDGTYPTVGALGAYVLMPCRVDALLLGAFCAWIVRQRRIVEFLIDHRKTLYATLFVLASGGAVLTLKYNPFLSVGWRNLGYTWIAMLYACFLLIVLTERSGIMKNITINPLFQRLGVIAYGVYLLHGGILGLSHGVLLHQDPKIRTLADVIVTALSIVCTIILASASWRYYEKRFLSIGRRVRYGSDQIIRATVGVKMSMKERGLV
jgi:peptidoglycan/LPS O-acetylase OafA/YrhL